MIITGRSRARRTVLRLWLVLAGSALTLMVSAGPAAAHNVLRITAPAAGADVARTPTSVVLTFDEPAIAMGTELTVTGPSGAVQSGRPRLVDDTVTQGLQGGAPAGTYTVLWRVTSVDGHPISGTFTFTSLAAGSGTATAAPPADRAPAPAPPVPSAIAIIVVAIAVAAALALLTAVLRRRRARPGRPVD